MAGFPIPDISKLFPRIPGVTIPNEEVMKASSPSQQQCLPKFRFIPRSIPQFPCYKPAWSKPKSEFLPKPKSEFLRYTRHKPQESGSLLELGHSLGMDYQNEVACPHEAELEFLAGWIPPPSAPQKIPPLHAAESFRLSMRCYKTDNHENDKHCSMADKKRCCVNYFHPMHQNNDYKPPPLPQEMTSILEKSGLYKEMQDEWPSFHEKEGEFWSSVYHTHGSFSVYSPLDYFKTGLNAAYYIATGRFLNRLDPGNHTQQQVLDDLHNFICEVHVCKCGEGEGYFITHINIPLNSALEVIEGRAIIVPEIPSGSLICF